MFRTANDAQFWDRAARKYAASAIADLPGYERTLARTRHYLAADHAVFEFGCGTGTTALKLAPSVRRMVASDISGAMIAIARERAAAEGASNVEFEIAAPDAGPWPATAFDVALGFNVLHLVAARQATLAGIHRLLKPGGLFISKTPCLKEMNPLVRLAVPILQALGKAPYVTSWSAAELEQEVAVAGFEIVERAHHGSRGRDGRVFLVARKR